MYIILDREIGKARGCFILEFWFGCMVHALSGLQFGWVSNSYACISVISECCCSGLHVSTVLDSVE